MAKKDEDEDLLDSAFSEDGEGGGEDDELDLLDSVEEDDSEGWVPDKAGEGIQGVVVKRGETTSDFSDEMVPVVTIETKSGDKFRIYGYGAVLRREILDADPQPGDLFACKYFGKKMLKKGKFQGKPYHHYGVAVRHRNRAA